MIAILFAAAVTLETVLPLCDQFLEKAGVTLDKPIAKAVSKSIVHAEQENATIILQDRYVLGYWREAVREFWDRAENVNHKLSRLDPAEMVAWSKQPCLLDERTAVEVGLKYFHGLGFKDEDFEPPECHQYRWQPSETNPTHVLTVPAFHIQWMRKGARENEHGFGPKIVMAISGATKRLVYFSSLSLR